MIKISDGLDCDPDITGNFDEVTFDDLEELDGDFLTGDGENYVMDMPDRWRGVPPYDALDKRLTREEPDIDVDDNLDDDPEMRYNDVDGHESLEFDNDGPRDPDHNRRMGRTTY